MTSITIRMVREYPPEGVVHVEVDHIGDITVLGDKQTVPQRIALEIIGTRDHFRGRDATQLSVIRHLALHGWRVTEPSLWTENERQEDKP